MTNQRCLRSLYNLEEREIEYARMIADERGAGVGGRKRILRSTLVDESERGGGTGAGNAKTETKTKRRTAGQASTSGFINSG